MKRQTFSIKQVKARTKSILNQNTNFTHKCEQLLVFLKIIIIFCNHKKTKNNQKYIYNEETQ